MKCVCRTACQIRMLDGSIRTFTDGQVFDFDGWKEVPPHFESLDKPVDFATATREELLASKWSFKQINEFCQATFKQEMPKGSKDNMVTALLDMRFRATEN